MNWFGKKRIFLDYASATPTLPEVRREMERFWSKDFYNSAAIYEEGLRVKKEIEDYRKRSARLLGISTDGIIFTGSGTESDNLAILGAFSKSLETIKTPHLIISSIEHPSVMSAAEEVVRRGGELSILEVNEDGEVSPEELKKLLKTSTFLVSVGLANGEIGTIQPITKIGRLVREYRKQQGSTYPYLHTDASQAVNYLDINLESLQVDLLTIDGSKIYGPKGVGALALRKGVSISPIIFGGRQEGGRRAGTQNPALISGFVFAHELAKKDMERESTRLENFREEFIKIIRKNLPQTIFNGSLENHLPNIVSVSLPNTLSEFIVLKLDKVGVLASVGSACSNDERVSGSPVIEALGKKDLKESTIRFSFGRFTTSRDIHRAAEIFCRVATSMLK